jgi:Protein of unknown function (DUF2997)
MSGQIKITIDRKATMTLEVEGAEGTHCLSLTEFLEEGVGQVISRQKTREFYQSAKMGLRNTIVRDKPK